MKRLFYISFIALLSLLFSCEREVSDDAREGAGGSSYRVLKVQVGNPKESDDEVRTRSVFDISSDGIYDVHLFAFYAESKGGNKQGDVVIYGSTAGDLSGQPASRAFYTPSGSASLREHLPFNWALPDDGTRMTVYTIVNANQSAADADIHSAHSALATALDAMAARTDLTESEFLASELFKAHYSDLDTYFGSMVNADMAEAPLIKTGRTTVSLSQNSTTTIYLRVYRLLSRFSIAMDAGINSAASVAERGYWLTLANAYVKNMNRDVDFFLDDMPDDGIPADVSASSMGSLCLGDYLSEGEISDFTGGAFVDFLVTPNDRGEKPSGVNASHWYDMYDTYMDAGGDAAEFASKGTYVEFVFEKHADFDGCANVAHARTDGRYLGQELVRLYLNNGKVKLNAGDTYYVPNVNNFRLVRNLSRRIMLKTLPASSSGELDIHWVDDESLRVLSYDASRQTSPSSVAGVSARSAEGPIYSRHTIRLYSEVPFDPSETDRVNTENETALIGNQVHWEVDGSDNHYAVCTFTPTDGSVKSIHFDRKRPYFRHLRPKVVDYDELQFDVPEKVYMGQRPDAVVTGYDEGMDVSQFSWSTTAKTKYSLAFQGVNWSMGMVDGQYAFDLTSVTGSGCTINGKRTGVQTLKFSVGQEGDDFYFDGPSFDVQVAAPTLLPLAFAEYQIGEDEKKVILKIDGEESYLKFYYLDDEGNILYNDDDIRFDHLRYSQSDKTPEKLTKLCNWIFLLQLDMLDINLTCDSPYIYIACDNFAYMEDGEYGNHYGRFRYYTRLRFNSSTGGSNAVFQDIVNRAVGLPGFDPFVITATPNYDIGIKTSPREVGFITPVLNKPNLITQNGFDVVGLNNYTWSTDNSYYGQDYYYEPIAGLIDPYYLNDDGSLKSNVKIKLDIDCGRYQGMGNMKTCYGDAFLTGDYNGNVCICWSAYQRDSDPRQDEHMPGKIKVGLEVTYDNYSTSYKATVPWFEFYRGVRYWYGLTANTVITSSTRVDGIVSSVLYDTDKTTQISSIPYFYDGDIDSWKDGIHLGTPSISDTYNLKTGFGANTQFDDDYRFGSNIYTFYAESLNPQSWYSSLPDFASIDGSVYPPSSFYNHMHPDVSIPRNRTEDVQKYFKEETGAFFDIRKEADRNSYGYTVDPYEYWPPLIYVSRLHPYQWVDEAAQAPLSSDNYVVDIYYDSYYEPVKWSDLTTAQKVAAGLAVLTLDPLTIAVVAGVASPWWVNRANIGFGLRISSTDTNDGSDYHITPINVTYDSGSGLSALAQYVDYIDFYSNKEQTSTFRVYTNALMQYRFPWNSMYQEWTDSGSGGFIHYGTNLQQYDTFYDDTFHDVSSSQPNSRDGIVMNAGIRINPNGAPSGAPKLTVVERGAYQVDSFTEFYGIAKIGFKEQYLKYQLRNSGMSAEYDVNYRHHYEPKFAHRTPGGDYYDDFSY